MARSEGAGMKYIRPMSLTWWSGVFALSVGVASLAMPDSYQVTQIGALVALLAGGADASPASLIALGLGLIGVRAAIEKRMQGGNDV
jgi:drug/metabolite transporter (DMT)-like permease